MMNNYEAIEFCANQPSLVSFGSIIRPWAIDKVYGPFLQSNGSAFSEFAYQPVKYINVEYDQHLNTTTSKIQQSIVQDENSPQEKQEKFFETFSFEKEYSADEVPSISFLPRRKRKTEVFTNNSSLVAVNPDKRSDIMDTNHHKIDTNYENIDTNYHSTDTNYLLFFLLFYIVVFVAAIGLNN